MKLSSKQWKKFSKSMSALSNQAQAEMATWIASQGGYTAIEFEVAIAKAYELTTKYGEASAALSALMYDTVAEVSGAAVPSAIVADTATLGEVSKAIYGASTYSQNSDYISGVVGRLVKQAGADTTLQNAKRDGAEFAWISFGDTCAFCELLSANGWQKASKETLQRLKREPQFVDAVFAAKTARTQMEEEPAMAVPNTEQEQNFIIEQEATPATETETKVEEIEDKVPTIDFADKEFDLSDISHKEKSREEIIAEAEAAAFSED